MDVAFCLCTVYMEHSSLVFVDVIIIDNFTWHILILYRKTAHSLSKVV